MERGLTGRYIATVAGGIGCQAFVLMPLPPLPKLVSAANCKPHLYEALTAIGRLDPISTLLPDAQLFVKLRAQGSGDVFPDRGLAAATFLKANVIKHDHLVCSQLECRTRSSVISQTQLGRPQ